MTIHYYSHEERAKHDATINEKVLEGKVDFWEKLIEDSREDGKQVAVFSLGNLFYDWKRYHFSKYSTGFFSDEHFRYLFVDEFEQLLKNHPVELHSTGLYFSLWLNEAAAPNIDYELNTASLQRVREFVRKDCCAQ